MKSGQKAYSTMRLPVKSYARSLSRPPTRIVYPADKLSNCVPLSPTPFPYLRLDNFSAGTRFSSKLRDIQDSFVTGLISIYL